jgi:hypothetical protein
MVFRAGLDAMSESETHHPACTFLHHRRRRPRIDVQPIDSHTDPLAIRDDLPESDCFDHK